MSDADVLGTVSGRSCSVRRAVHLIHICPVSRVQPLIQPVIKTETNTLMDVNDPAPCDVSKVHITL